MSRTPYELWERNSDVFLKSHVCEVGSDYLFYDLIHTYVVTAFPMHARIGLQLSKCSTIGAPYMFIKVSSCSKAFARKRPGYLTFL